MTEQERYERIDLPFYRERVAPLLPPQVLDFHTHAWTREHWRQPPGDPAVCGAKYMVTESHYTADDLLADGRRLFPDRIFGAVVFGQPTPIAFTDRCNDYIAQPRPGLLSLMIVGRGMMPRKLLEEQIIRGGFFGYKVFLNWSGDAYGHVTLDDMLGPEELALANELRLVVLWHVPGARRLTDPRVQQDLRRISERYPSAQIVLAHCGRCYHPEEMRLAVKALREMPGVYLDTAMVMDPCVLAMLLGEIDSRRLLFATDLPVAAMRGRRVNVMDHWVDLVLEGYPPSQFRVQSDNMRATFMVYEIILAIERAAELAGLSADERCRIFWDNGMAVLSGVMEGQVLRRHRGSL